MRTEGVRLTRREQEVMELVFLGLSDKEIPEYLVPRRGVPVSISTVRNIIANIKAKLQVQHRTELSLWWAISNYKISVDWSPMKRKICALMMSVLLLPQIVTIQSDDMIRTRRTESSSRAISSRLRRGHRDEMEDDTWNIIN